MLLKADTLLADRLDWAVAKCLGHDAAWFKDRKRGYRTCFSSSWNDGGWLLEQCVEHGMQIERVDPQLGDSLPKFKVSLDHWESVYRSDQLLVAVCQAYVAYKLGMEVDIPQEVLVLQPTS